MYHEVRRIRRNPNKTCRIVRKYYLGMYLLTIIISTIQYIQLKNLYNIIINPFETPPSNFKNNRTFRFYSMRSDKFKKLER